MKSTSEKLRFFPILSVFALAGCSQPFDIDLRDTFGGQLNTADAARQATADRPTPDARGVISYPGYQVAVARRGDTVASVAQRVGIDPNQLARFNGRTPDAQMRANEILALPGRVAEPAGGPIQPEGTDITSIAGGAIDTAEASAVQTSTLPSAPQIGAEPIRHQVERGETAFTIARLYNVSVRSLADWNGLGADFAVSEGQYLLIPVVLPQETSAATEPPGSGTPTPLPPSSSKPLPNDDEPAASTEVTSVAPDLSQARAETGRMSFPVRGDIIREYSKGKNDGIDITAPAGTAVKAAAGGNVAAITKDTNGSPIIVIRHPDNLLTVYSNVADLQVEKGDSVSQGQQIAAIRRDGANALHFEVRQGIESVDPNLYLQ